MSKFSHKKLTEKELRFCYFYVFGLPLNNIDNLLRVFNHEPKEKGPRQEGELFYKKPENSLKYCFDNATGSYYKAFGCKYSSAKASSYRLLKRDAIKEEIALMHFYITRLGYTRLEASKHYISPNSSIYSKEEIRESWKVSPEELKTGKLRNKIK